MVEVVRKYLSGNVLLKYVFKHRLCRRGVVLGRRRKKIIRIPKKQLPKIFLCPKCGKDAIRIDLLRNENRAILKCGSCGLKEDLPMKAAYKEVDIYSNFTDKWYAQGQTTTSGQ
jgi:transcription elongation factor Elf1